MECFMASSTAQSLLAKVVREEVELRTAAGNVVGSNELHQQNKFSFLEF